MFVRKIARIIGAEGNIQEEILEYGLKQMLLSLLNFVTTMVLGIVFGCVYEGCIFILAYAYNKSNEKSLKPVSENGLSGVLTDRNNKIKLITGVAPFDDILFMDDDFDDSSSEDDPVENSPVVTSPVVSSSKSSFQ